MKIHTADDVTPYKYTMQCRLLFKLPESRAYDQLRDYYYTLPAEENDAYDYVKRVYPNLLDTVELNKRPKNLCGQHELHGWLTVKSDRNCEYMFWMKVTGFGIEYSIPEIQAFFLDLFPEFEPVISEKVEHSFRTSHSQNKRLFEYTIAI